MLQGFESTQPNVNQIQAPNIKASDTAARQAQQNFGDLTSRLENFSSFKMKQHEAATIDKAQKDAYNDSLNGKPFHSKSVTTAYGKAYNSVASATYASQADLTINQRSLELAQQFENDPAAYSKAMGEFIKSMSTEAPTPELASVISITGDKTKNSIFGKLTIAQNQRIKASQVETFHQEWDLNLNQVVELAATGKHDDSELLKQKNLVHLGAMVNEGLVTPEAAQKVIKDGEFKLTYGIDTRNMQELINKGDLKAAKTFLDDKTAENRHDMDIPENDKYRSGLTKMYNSAVKAAEAGKKKQVDFSTQVINDEINIMKEGKTSATPTDKVKEALQNASKGAQYNYIKEQQVQKILDKYGFLSLTEQEDLLNEYKAKGDASGVDVAVMERLEKRLKERSSAAKNDVVGLAIREGVIDNPPPMGADSGVDGLLSGLSVMKDNSSKIQTEYGVDKTSLLSKQDAQSWADYMNSSNVTVDEKLAVIQQVADNYPDQAKNVFAQIGGKNAGTFLFSADLATSGNVAAAKIAMMGKNADVELDEGIKQDLKIKLGNAFGGYNSDLFNRMYTGILDYAKGSSLNNEVLDVDDIVEKSIGAVAKYNDKKVVIPYGVDKSDFEDWLDNIVIPGRPNVQKGLRDMTDFVMSGDYTLQYAGQGQYYIKVNNNGNPFFINDTEDETKPMLLKWGK